MELIFVAFFLPFFNLFLWILLRKKSAFLYLLPSILFLTIWLFLLISHQNSETWLIRNWLKIGNYFSADIVLELTSRTLVLVSLNAFVTLLIQIYSFAYLSRKDNFGLYNTLISMFSASMAWFFLAGNLFTMLLAWEWLGLVSYLLVQFWYENQKPIQAGLKVFLINKLGDFGLVVGLGLLLSFGFGSTLFQETAFPEGAEVFFRSKAGNLLSIFLVLGALIKSAQFPFNIWLKEAMQGPTAVSALLHSATMVVGGVWLLFQLSPVFSPEMHWFLLLVGGFTLLISNAMAIFSMHLKNSLAFSTMAQLGLMTLAIGLGKNEESLLHLVSHAFFKSSLFLICGVLMNQLKNAGFQGSESDYLPNLKGILKSNSILKFSFLACLAALAGWPLTSGFISKESIMPAVLSGHVQVIDWVAFAIIQLGIFSTAFYATRIAIQVCYKSEPDGITLEKTSLLLTIPVLILSFGAGFWLFGVNPFSTGGWLSDVLLVKGSFVFPDVLFLLIGTILAWHFSKANVWKSLPFPEKIKLSLLEMKFQNSAITLGWKCLLRSTYIAGYIDTRLIDRSLNAGSKIFVIGGHFTNFADRKIIDGLISGIVALVKFLGFNLWTQTNKAPQSVVFIVVLVFIFILYFSY